MTTLGIAGWRIGLHGIPAWLDQAMADRYEAFIEPDGAKPDASVAVTLKPDRTEDQRLPYAVTRNGEVCLVDMPGGCGKICLDRWQMALGLESQHFWFYLEFALKIFVAYLALRQGGLLLHCSGVLADGGAYLFTGEGGSGKSTVVALSSDKVALNDDLVVLRRGGSCWWAYGTPFWNQQAARRDGQTADGPVIGIFKLVQDHRVYLEPISGALALGELAANCPTVNSDPLELPTALHRCREVAEAVKVQRLHFCKSPSFWTVLSKLKDPTRIESTY